MASIHEPEIYETHVTINDIPELAFREILKYLDDETIWFTLRDVCMKIRQHVDAFVEMKGIFMLTGENNFPSKIIYIYKKGEKGIKGRYDLGPACPKPISNVIELAQKRQEELFEQISNYEVPFFTNNSCCLGFDYKSRYWKTYQENVPLCNDISVHNIQLISNPELFEFYIITSMGPVPLEDCNPSYMSLNARYLRSECREDGSYTVHSQCIYSIELPPDLKDLRYFTLVRCSPREIIFVGGTYIRPYQPFSDPVHSQNSKIWHGELSTNGRNMIWNWNWSDLENNNGIRGPIWGLEPNHLVCIKLKNNVYILVTFSRMCFYNWDTYLPRMGKMSCDRYDWILKKYDRNVFHVPFAFCRSHELRSVSSKCETFAIIISRQWIRREGSSYDGEPRRTQRLHDLREQVWIFNETDGFAEIPSLETTFDSIFPHKFEKLVRIE